MLFLNLTQSTANVFKKSECEAPISPQSKIYLHVICFASLQTTRARILSVFPTGNTYHDPYINVAL